MTAYRNSKGRQQGRRLYMIIYESYIMEECKHKSGGKEYVVRISFIL